MPDKDQDKKDDSKQENIPHGGDTQEADEVYDAGAGGQIRGSQHVGNPGSAGTGGSGGQGGGSQGGGSQGALQGGKD
jgi:hypothetical protein